MSSTPESTRDPRLDKPWPAMWSLVIGFFMIMIDTTVVTVALPNMQEQLSASLSAVIWVTSAYLLAYAVPLLISGRLGDRFGQKNMYMLGMAVFTLASLWCGLSPNVEMLIAARVMQGLGASLMTPQTMSIITLMFPPNQRGVAMSVWGAVAGIASLIGPILGGVLVDGPGWAWIFFINIPVGVVGLFLSWRFVPTFSHKQHSFDWLGVALSATGLFLLVFGIQEGSTYSWGTITDSLWGTGISVSVWGLIITGAIIFALFILWQAINKNEPLIPLSLFKDRNFSVGNIAIAAMGGAVITMAFPITIYFQQVRGMTPTQAALMTIPLAVISGALSPAVGKMMAKHDPKWYAAGGFLCLVIGYAWLRVLMVPESSIVMLLLPFAVLGVGNALIWGPLAVNTTRNLAPRVTGAGSGVYNETRQIASVLCSAAIATVMSSAITDQVAKAIAALPAPARAAAASADTSAVGHEGGMSGVLPEFLHAPFSAAMSDSLILPLALSVVGVVACLFFAPPVDTGAWSQGRAPENTPGSASDAAAE